MVDDFAGADGVADFGEGGGVEGGIGGEDDEVGVHAGRDAASMGGIAEASGRVRGERSENLLEGQSGARHPCEFFRGVELLDVADIGAEEDLATEFGVGAKLRQGRLFHSLFKIRDGHTPAFDMPERERGNEGNVSGFQAREERWVPRTAFGRCVGKNIHTTLQTDFNSVLITGMGKDGFARAMRFGDSGFRQIQRHDENAVLLDGACKKLHAVGTVVKLLAYTFDGLGTG